MLDIRPFKAYEREHLTKPAQCTTNAPWGDGEDVTKLIKRVELVGLTLLRKQLALVASSPLAMRGDLKAW